MKYTNFNWFNDIRWDFVVRNCLQSSVKCRARSDCMYVKTDRALHSPQNNAWARRTVYGLLVISSSARFSHEKTGFSYEISMEEKKLVN